MGHQSKLFVLIDGCSGQWLLLLDRVVKLIAFMVQTMISLSIDIVSQQGKWLVVHVIFFLMPTFVPEVSGLS